MQDHQNIEELFREGFNNFEQPVRPELWNNISAQIGASTPAPPSSGTPSPIIESVVTTSKMSVTIASWIAAAAVVVSGVAGYVYYKSTQSPKASIEIQVPVNQEQSIVNTPTPTEISKPETSENKSTGTGKEVSSVTDNRKSSIPANSTKLSESNQANESGINGGQNDAQTEANHNKPAQTATPNSNDTKPNNNNSSNQLADENTAKPIVIANPSIGYAPLAVNFSIKGDFQKADWEFSDGSTVSKSAPFEHIFEKPGIYSATLKINDLTGNSHSEVIKIEVLADLNIKNIPNVFTPNMDGSNDIFTFNTENLTDLEVSIFDKSGKLVYKWNGLENGWDGKNSSGQEVEEGTYFYVIFATGFGNQKHQQGGTITLIR